MILDEIIGKSKSFEDQIKSLEKVENLGEYWHSKGFGDKKLESKYVKIKLVHMSNIIDKELFEQIFGYTLEKLAKKLIYTTNKEENQIIVENINKHKDKLYEMDSFYNWVIQPSNRRINLIDSIKLILDFSEEFSQMSFENVKIKK